VTDRLPVQNLTTFIIGALKKPLEAAKINSSSGLVSEIECIVERIWALGARCLYQKGQNRSASSAGGPVFLKSSSLANFERGRLE
jgi:hypothetical protein